MTYDDHQESVVSARRTTIASVPNAHTEKNPYLRLFYSALEKHGCEYYGGITPAMIEGREELPQIDWFHIHWPEHMVNGVVPYITRLAYARLPGAWRLGDDLFRRFPRLKLRRLRRFIASLTKRGVRICWTVHNLSPHECDGWLERGAYELIAKHADLRIFHSAAAVSEYRSRYGDPGCHVIMPHGNYDGIFPPPNDLQALRAELALSEHRPVFGLIGELRSNKGVDIVIEAAQLVAAECDILLAGTVSSGMRESLSIKPHALPANLRLVDRQLTDAEYANFIAICDGILLPYRRATTSGALMSALTLERAVIVSDLPAFTKVLAGDREAGIVLASIDGPSLAEAIRAFLRSDRKRRHAAARSLADDYGWTELTESVATVLHRNRSGRPAPVCARCESTR